MVPKHARRRLEKQARREFEPETPVQFFWNQPEDELTLVAVPGSGSLDVLQFDCITDRAGKSRLTLPDAIFMDRALALKLLPLLKLLVAAGPEVGPPSVAPTLACAAPGRTTA